MTCEDALARIERYVDGELPEQIVAALVDHLADCAACLDRADFQRRLRQLLGRKLSAHPPDDLLWRVRRGVQETSGPSLFGWRQFTGWWPGGWRKTQQSRR